LANSKTDANTRVHHLELDVARLVARIASLEVALRQRSMQLESLDSCEALAPPSQPTSPTVPFAITPQDTNETIAFLRDHLDGAYYLRQNPDVARAAMDPVLHYVLHGEQEGRRPCPEFDPVRYRVMNPSLAQFNGSLFRYYLTNDQVSGSVEKG
jgi:hypothetical protein